MNDESEETRRARAAAASARPVVSNPKTAVLRQVAHAGVELGFAALAHVLRGMRNLEQYVVPEADLSDRVRDDDDAPEAAMTTDPEGAHLGTLEAGSLLAGLQLDEGCRWLAYAAAAYQLTPAGIVDKLHELGVYGAEEAQILFAQLQPQPLLQPHFIMRDPAKRAIVIAIRGTATVRDVIADMAARPIPFAGGAAHTGMAAAVDGLLHYDIPSEPQSEPEPEPGQAAAAEGLPAGAPHSLAPPPVVSSGVAGERTVEPSESTALAAEAPAPDARAAAPPAQAAPPSIVAPGMPAGPASPGPGSPTPFGFSVPFMARMAEEAQRQGKAAAAAAGAGAGARGSGPSLAYNPFAAFPAFATVGMGGVAALCQRYLARFPDHRVIITGHSLGAGIASLLTMKVLRIILYMRRQQLEAARTQAAGAAAAAAVPTAVGVDARPATQAGDSAAATEAALQGLLPPRPLHCWAYAAPACMGPELSALSALSMADIEDALLDDRPFLEAFAGPAAAKRFLAAREEARAALAEAEVCVQGRNAPAGSAVDCGSHAGVWQALRRLPIVTSVVFGDDMVPRLTVPALKDLADRMRRVEERRAAAAPTAPACCGCCGFFGKAQTQTSAPPSSDSAEPAPAVAQAAVAEGSASAALTSAIESQVPEQTGEPGTPRAPGLILSDEHSAALQPLASVEAAEHRPEDPLHAAAQQTAVAQAAVLEHLEDFAGRLKGTALPAPVARRVLEVVLSTKTPWYRPHQVLVPPGCIFLVARAKGAARHRLHMHHHRTEDATAASGSPASRGAPGHGESDAAADGRQDAHPTVITVGSAGPAQLRYVVHRVTPAALDRMILSPSMVTDHMLGEYRRCMVALAEMSSAGAPPGTAGATPQPPVTHTPPS